MSLTTFSGRIKDAEGGSIHMSISGPNHFFFSNSYTEDFDEPLNLSGGLYDVAVSAYTDGTFTFDISQGKVTPKVPDKYTDKSKEDYTLRISDQKKVMIAKAISGRKRQK